MVPLAHHATSVYLTEISERCVRARMKMITIFPNSLFSVDYDWRVTRASGPWRIARQRISLVGKVPLRPTAPTKTASSNVHAG